MVSEPRRRRLPTRDDITRLAREIGERFAPEQVILFGSYARGAPADGSDVDILVVMETDEGPVKAAARICSNTTHPFPLDLLVRTPAELARRLSLGDFFLREVLEKGEVLYERADPGVGE